MCGIAGIHRYDGATPSEEALHRMADLLAHRGPDGAGTHVDGPAGLAHRRLSILDLSEAGAQPMHRDDLVIAYNGEVYNYRELRDELRELGHTFETGTDTEVVLAAYQEWGPDCLHRFNGMFAFGLWDATAKHLFLARDRWGIKPLHYVDAPERFAFASEMKALLHGLPHEPRVDASTARVYLEHGIYDHRESTFFDGVKRLLPGHRAVVTADGLRTERWYEPASRAGSPEDAAERYRELLTDAVRLRLRSDVPVGSCLSGGLDSSSIVCLVRNVADADDEVVTQRTFSNVADDPRFDESPYMEQVVERTDADAHTTQLRAEEIPDLMPRLQWHQEEPFSSLSIAAQWKVMECARNGDVTVLLDGQGADEALAGYHNFFAGRYADLLRRLRLTTLLRETRAFREVHGGSPAGHVAEGAYHLLPASLQGVVQRWDRRSERRVLGPRLRDAPGPAPQRPRERDSVLHDLLHHSVGTATLPALLRQEDRNSMAFSLEARVPFLDHRLVEYTQSLPPEALLEDGVTKRVLRDAMEGILPEGVRTRMDKMGFVTPQEVWMRGELAPWIRGIVTSDRLAERGLVDPNAAREILEEVEAGGGDWNLLWRIVNLELWARVFLDGEGGDGPPNPPAPGYRDT